MLHTGCTLERRVIKETLTYSGDRCGVNAKVLKYIEKAVLKFKDTLNISLSEDEIYYIFEILKNQYQNIVYNGITVLKPENNVLKPENSVLIKFYKKNK